MSSALEPPLAPPGSVKLHHIGFVLDSIEENAEQLALSLGTTWDGEIIFDPVQNVKVTFLKGAVANESMIELVEPGGPESPVAGILERGGGLHHLCYEVEDLDSHLDFCRAAGMIIMRKPVAAVAFGGRRIAWALTKKRLLIEYLEERRKPLLPEEP